MPRTPDGAYELPRVGYEIIGEYDDGTPWFIPVPLSKPSHVAQTAASRVQAVMTPDDVKDWEADKLLHSVLQRKAEMAADRKRIIEGYK